MKKENSSPKDLSVGELVAKRNELRQKIFEAKIKNATRSLKQTHIIKEYRKQLAQVSTFLSSKSKQGVKA